MGIIIIFSLIALLGLVGLYRAFKEKNFLSMFFSLGAVAIFGWFAVMTLIHHGIPVVSHV
ncbi:DUF2759 domain-containing protein [Metabacillus sp. RGM 3146]|uniref:DUF2759 domain-containing protein n=1 Tax=Metabacillus sp. RGM 3146 TaxID=3401092 RepID=UPI003B9DB54E